MLLAVLLAASLSLAQETTGTVQGTLLDPSGAAIPGARIDLVQDSTGVTLTQTSGADGKYIFNLVPPGSWSVRATLTGFRPAVLTGVIVEVARNTRADVTMQIGQVSEVVEVSSSVARIDTVSAQVATGVERKYITDLPSSGRNALSYALLAPGVNLNNAGSQVMNIEGTYASVNGNRAMQNAFFLDGTDNTGSFRNSALQFPNPEAVQEVTVSTNSTSAEFGKQPGGIFNVMTRSGTNELHGSGFYFFRDAALNANTFERNKSNQARPAAPLKQGGGTIGGPVVRNRTFFFGSYQHYRDQAAQLQNTNRFPTADLLKGNFSAFDKQLYDPDTGLPLANNQIPSRLMDPVAARLAAGLLPTVSNFGDRYIWSFAETVRNNETLAKVDHSFTQNHITQFSYFRTWGQQVLPQAGGAGNNVPKAGPQLNDSRQDTISGRHTWIVSPSVVVQNRFGYAKHSADRGQAQLGRDLSDFGATWPLVQDGARKYLPSINVSDGFKSHQGWLSLFEQWNLRFGSTASWTTGKHNVRFGAEFQRDTVMQRNDQDGLTFSFDGRSSSKPAGGKPLGVGNFGYAMADFVMGRSSSFSASGILSYNLFNWSDFFFVQDQWRVTPKLTLTPGLRYEIYSPATESDNRASAFIYNHRSNLYPNAPLHMAFLGDTGIPAGFFEQDRNNFAPRLGLAYDVKGDGRTVIRAGYGFYYAYNATQIKMWNAERTPWRPSASGGETRNLVDPWGTSQTVVYTAPPTPFSADVSNFKYPPRIDNPVGFDTNFRTPYTQQWNVTFVREIVRGVTVEAGYVGNRGFKLLQVLPFNYPLWTDAASLSNIHDRRPIKSYGSVSIIHSRARSWYDSLQIASDLRFNKRLTSRLTYTYGDLETLSSNDPTDSGIQTVNPFNLDGERAWDAARHMFRAFYVYDVPLFANTNTLAGKIAGGWQVSGSMNVASGSPSNVTLGEDWNYDGIGNDRPDRAGAIAYTSGSKDQRQANYFSLNSFAKPAIRNTFGNLERNALEGPGSWNIDLGLLKNFRITERMNAQFRAEAYNLTNSNFLSGPNTAMNSRDFGRVLTRWGSRTMQLGLRFQF
ncbi:MAG: carboxypeptidase regulatory-like domain-containing protein [Bryobacteraceae bacterium]|nr:carboxypeptidase regulatory-like domain-containing protein [Bryobacteraceae bacterium]